MRRWLKNSLLALASVAGAVTLAAAVSFAVADTPQVAKTVTDDASLPAWEVDGVKLHLETHGDPDKQTIVFLHGGPGNDYLHLLPLKPLSDEYHLVFYDQRGAGLSERVESSEITLETLVQELDQVAKRASPDKKVNIVGHSWGGMLAAAYLERHAERVNRMVLIEPGFLTQETVDYFLEESNGGVPGFSLPLLAQLWSTGFEALKVDGPDDDAALDYFLLTLATSDVPHHPMAAYYCPDREKKEFATWRMGVRSSIAIQTSGFNAERQMTTAFVGEKAKKFQGPILILAGGCNTLIGVEQQKKHLPLFGNARLEEVPAVGHMMIEEEPEKLLGLIREHLSAEAH